MNLDLRNCDFIINFQGFPVFEIRKNLDLRKILGVTNIFLKSSFVCSTQSTHVSKYN